MELLEDVLADLINIIKIYPKTGITISIIVLILYTLYLLYHFRINNNRNKYQNIKQLLSDDIAYKSRVIIYYLTVALLIVFCVLSYILFIYFVISLKKAGFKFNTINSIHLIISFIFFTMLFFSIMWMKNHSHLLKKDYLLVYYDKDKLFVVLNIVGSYMLSEPINKTCIDNNNSLNKLNLNNKKRIQNISILCDNNINYIKNNIK